MSQERNDHRHDEESDRTNSRTPHALRMKVKFPTFATTSRTATAEPLTHYHFRSRILVQSCRPAGLQSATSRR
jgi:hypothetical protein